MKRLNKAFKAIETLEPPLKLEAAILRNMRNAQNRQIRQNIFLSYIGLASSTMAVFYTIFSFGQAILKSEFWNIAMLALTDSGIVLANWRDFLYSILETFPVLSLAIILMPISILFLSVGSYINLSHKNNFNHTHDRVCA